MKNKSNSSNSAVAYLRVSTDKQEVSMELQEEKIRAYCTLKGFTLVEVLKEPDVSGKTRLYDRPEGGRIPLLISSGCSHVIALKLDRIFRNAGDALVVSEEWLKGGVSLHIVDMSGSAIDTGSPQGRMFFTMLAGFAEFERGMISERTSAALQHRKRSGVAYCGKTPYGMKTIGGVGKAGGGGGKLVAYKEESDVISKMREQREKGQSYRQIARALNRAGVFSKEGREWHPFTIARILAA